MKEIIRQLRAQRAVNLNKTPDERAIFRLHVLLYHRPVREFDKSAEYCKVFQVVTDQLTFEEVLKVAASSEQV